MNIEICKNQDKWDKWICDNSEFNPLAQSFDWGEILVSENKEVERICVEDSGEVLLQAQITYNNLFFNLKYAFCQSGPITSPKPIKSKAHKVLINYIKQKGCVFLRVEPSEIFDEVKMIKTIDITPRATSYLELEKTEEEILKNMHSKTRYNIRLAEKKEVKINNQKNLEIFYNLIKKTGERDKFNLHSKKHYEKVLESENIHQLNALHENKIIASAVFFAYGNTFTYLYGASDYEFRNLMAPHLLQWEGIKLGKSLGYKYYDFYGIAPQKDLNNKNHQYAGVTRFKLGFGGEIKENIGTHDIVLNKNKYKLYKLLRYLRRKF